MIDQNYMTDWCYLVKYSSIGYDSAINKAPIRHETDLCLICNNLTCDLPNVTLGNLRIRTHRAKNILMLFGEKGVGIDRIKLVTCSASDISRLNNTQIQNIIDYVNDQLHIISKTVTNGNDQSHMTSAKTISSV